MIRLAIENQSGDRIGQNSAAAGTVSAPAQFRLAKIYEEGEKVAQDKALAASFYRLSAEQGYAKAQYALADLYYRGFGLPEGNQQAVAWYVKAAEN